MWMDVDVVWCGGEPVASGLYGVPIHWHFASTAEVHLQWQRRCYGACPSTAASIGTAHACTRRRAAGLAQRDRLRRIFVQGERDKDVVYLVSALRSV
jgi:hypothetical protein